MKYVFDPSVVEKTRAQEVKYKKAPYTKSFIKAFILYVVVMLIGLAVGYMAYVKFGIYSPKNLLCFMVGIALFCMGFMRLFSRIGSYVDTVSALEHSMGSILWNATVWLRDTDSISGTLEEVENGYVAKFNGNREHTIELTPDTISSIFMNASETQCMFRFNEPMQLMIADGMFKTETGEELKVVDIMKRLASLGINDIYCRGAEVLTSETTHTMSGFKLWSGVHNPLDDIIITEDKAPESVEDVDPEATVEEAKEAPVEKEDTTPEEDNKAGQEATADEKTEEASGEATEDTEVVVTSELDSEESATESEEKEVAPVEDASVSGEPEVVAEVDEPAKAGTEEEKKED